MFLSVVGFLGFLWARPHAHSKLLLHQTIERGNLLNPSLPSRIEVKGLQKVVLSIVDGQWKFMIYMDYMCGWASGIDPKKFKNKSIESFYSDNHITGVARITGIYSSSYFFILQNQDGIFYKHRNYGLETKTNWQRWAGPHCGWKCGANAGVFADVGEKRELPSPWHPYIAVGAPLDWPQIFLTAFVDWQSGFNNRNMIPKSILTQ